MKTIQKHLQKAKKHLLKAEMLIKEKQEKNVELLKQVEAIEKREKESILQEE